MEEDLVFLAGALGACLEMTSLACDELKEPDLELQSVAASPSLSRSLFVSSWGIFDSPCFFLRF